ncbi:hypothetical protein BROOK1789C_2240, partial [Bathymodiolus brooksi thiotrophic gill symbiont]
VDHGADLTQEGAQSLVDKAKILQQTYSNDNTRIKRIALVGCDTDGVSQGLTRNFARIVYNDIPALQHTEITGRTGQVQVNDDGTKTMTTDGTKTIYSWDNDKGEIAQKTETVKRYSDSLENPLSDLANQIKKIEKLLDSKKFQSHKKSKHQDILVNTLEVLHEIQRNGLEHSLGKLEPVRSDFHAHLEQNPSSEISTKLGKIYSFLNEYMRKLKAYSMLQSSLYEECDKAELLGVDRKIEKLEDIRNQLSKTLRGESDMNLWAKKDRSYIERRIQRAKKSQEKLREWKQPVVTMDNTDPFIGYEHQVVVTVGNDQT